MRQSWTESAWERGVSAGSKRHEHTETEDQGQNPAFPICLRQKSALTLAGLRLALPAQEGRDQRAPLATSMVLS